MHRGLYLWRELLPSVSTNEAKASNILTADQIPGDRKKDLTRQNVIHAEVKGQSFRKRSLSDADHRVREILYGWCR